MKAYIVQEQDYDCQFIVAVFLDENLANQFVDKKESWKKDFEKEFGKSFDDVYYSYKLDRKMEDWLDNHAVNLSIGYSIIEKEITEKL